MVDLRTFLRRHSLWVGFLAVIIPLLIILSLQYQSLVKLEATSPIARKVTLKTYLWTVAEQVESFYRANAERALNVSSYTLTQDRFYKVAYHFKKKNITGADQLFVTLFPEKNKPQLFFYNPERQSMEPRSDCPQSRAVNLACTPWRLISLQGATVESTTLVVNERDPQNRIILNPIIDESSKVIGIAGMIVDMSFFRDYYLPKVIKETLPKSFPDGDCDNVIVTVHDGNGRLVYATQPLQGQDDVVYLALPFIFKDWKLGIRSRYETPEQWAGRYFAINLSLSILMTMVLISGIVLAWRTASREMKLSQMKADFVSNVSHELRTPLASIRVFGEFLKMGRVKELEKIREYGQYIETESRRLTQLISNILDFSKIESGQKTYKFEPASIEEVVAETLRTLEVQLRQQGFTIAFDPPERPLSPVIMDSHALAQAVMNLLDNAVKYSGSAKEILVRLRQKNGEVTITVTDHGIGIPHQEQEKIFERFHRVSTGLVHDVKGSGLGLSIVKHIVEAHRGRVTVSSELGRGSTFVIHLPAGTGTITSDMNPATKAH
jgi:signal transduction histidine kinase